jgi:hypothetical protein
MFTLELKPLPVLFKLKEHVRMFTPELKPLQVLFS